MENKNLILHCNLLINLFKNIVVNVLKRVKILGRVHKKILMLNAFLIELIILDAKDIWLIEQKISGKILDTEYDIL